MEDLTSWVAREAQNMGVDFACLPQQARNSIISILMSGLENGFRSRMDSPDLKFAKRKGIGDTRKLNSHSSNMSSLLIIDSTTCRNNGTVCHDVNCSHNNSNCVDHEGCFDGPCKNTPAEAPGCVDISPCTDLSCLNENYCHDSRLCKDNNCNDAGVCSDTGDSVNECTDLASCKNHNCSDDFCIDNYCENRSTVSTPQCVDISSSCVDTRCQNTNCQDTVDCIDSSRCINEYSCSDSSNCTDDTCRNTTTCSDNTRCTDNACKNNSPDFQCSDNGSSQAFCTDSECRNSNCPDNLCKDIWCANKGNKYSICIDYSSGSCADTDCTNTVMCSDAAGGHISSTNCTDNGCLNSQQCADVGYSSVNRCVDNSCMNITQCQDTNCEDEPCVNIADDGPPCPLDNNCQQVTDSPYCQDKACINWIQTKCLDNGCVNSPHYCNVQGDWDQMCTNAPRCNDACSVATTAYCLDGNLAVGACTDISCTDNALCNNESEIIAHCIDAGCIDEKCTNTNTNCIDTPGATSSACKDQGCNNQTNCADYQGCSDEQTPTASGCINSKMCTDYMPCIDSGCNNAGFCFDVGSQGIPCLTLSTDNHCHSVITNQDTTSCIDQGLCINNGQTECPSVLNFSHDCIDNDCCDLNCLFNVCTTDTVCTYSSECSHNVDNGCHNASSNENPYTCIDSSGCSDNSCINDDCQDDFCTDNSCNNNTTMADCTDHECPDISCQNRICHDGGNCLDSPCGNGINPPWDM